MSVMTAPQFVLPADRPLTVADLDLTPDDGQRYELDDGVLVVSAAPIPIHQRALLRLAVFLDRVCPPEFEVLPGPGVEMSEINYWRYAEVGSAVRERVLTVHTPFPIEIVPAELVAGPWRQGAAVG